MAKEKIEDQNGKDTGLTFSNYSGDIVTKSEEQLQEEKRKLEAIDKMTQSELQKGTIVSTKYWDASVGDELRGVYDGFKPIESEGKPLIAIQITTSEGKYLAAGQHLVEAFIGNSIKAGSAVHVKHTGLSGRMKMFEVRILEV